MQKNVAGCELEVVGRYREIDPIFEAWFHASYFRLPVQSPKTVVKRE